MQKFTIKPLFFNASLIYGDATLSGYAIADHANINERAFITENAYVKDAKVHGKAVVSTPVYIGDISQ